MKECPKCKGEGTAKSGRNCPACQGAGKVTVERFKELSNILKKVYKDNQSRVSTWSIV